MFREIILLIFRSTRLCVTVCGIMHRRCCRPPVGSNWLNTNALVVTVARLRAERLGYRTSTPGRDKKFSLLQRVGTIQAVLSNAYPVCTGEKSVGVNAVAA